MDRPAPPDSVQSLSEASARLRRFKRNLVADLFTQQGKFGELVQELRVAAKITPIVGIPPEDTFVHYPPLQLEQAGGEGQQLFRYLWISQMHKFRDVVVPQVYRTSYELSRSWITFLSACLLYDPPETDLLRFARYADPVPLPSEDDKAQANDPETEKKALEVPVLPIEWLQDPQKAIDDAHWYRDAIIDEIGKQFLEPLGLDIQEMYETVVHRIRDYGTKPWTLGHKYVDRQLANEHKPYIFVTEETTEDDVKKAFRSIRASQQQRGRGGRPTRDRLVAIQCAVLYDRYRSMDSTDKRRRNWTYESLAKEFDLDSADAAEDYVNLGRKLMDEKVTP